MLYVVRVVSVTTLVDVQYLLDIDKLVSQLGQPRVPRPWSHHGSREAQSLRLTETCLI